MNISVFFLLTFLIVGAGVTGILFFITLWRIGLIGGKEGKKK